MLSDPVAEAFGLIHRHPSGENFFRANKVNAFQPVPFSADRQQQFYLYQLP